MESLINKYGIEQVNAAVLYAKYCGQRGTPKQVELILKNTGGRVVEMAKERGLI